MLLDLNDPTSVVNWWAVFPERHGALLNDWSQRRPEYRASIARARALIKADPKLRAALALSRAASRPTAHDEMAASAQEL